MKLDAPFAALDLGSNSFQLIIAREISGRLEVLHKEKIRVHLAAGLNDEFIISEQALCRAENALREFSTTLVGFKPSMVKIIATYTLRVAKNKKEFLKRAEAILPFTCEIVSGEEEARLIYQGVASYHSCNEQRLVIDIGGGSTELIIGKQSKSMLLASRNMGCVTYQKRFFADGSITENQFKQATLAAAQELEPISNQYNNMGWNNVLGTSGSFKAIANVAHSLFGETKLTLKILHKVKTVLVSFQHIENIHVDGLSNERRPIIVPALAIVTACFEVFEIDELEYCDFSLREGVLHELVCTTMNKELKINSIINFSKRFNCDLKQSGRVRKQLKWLIQKALNQWSIDKEHIEIMMFATYVYEVGLSISSSDVHKHSAYIIANSLLPGFNQSQQTLLTTLIRNFRKKIKISNIQNDYSIDQSSIIKMICLFRLAIILTRKRQSNIANILDINVNRNSLEVLLNKEWVSNNALFLADLDKENNYLRDHQIHLAFKGVTS